MFFYYTIILMVWKNPDRANKKILHLLISWKKFHKKEKLKSLYTTWKLSINNVMPIKRKKLPSELLKLKGRVLNALSQEDSGSILGRVIPKAQKMVLNASLLNTQHYKIQIRGKWSKPWKGVVPFTIHRCRKASLWVTINYGRTSYIYIYIYKINLNRESKIFY